MVPLRIQVLRSILVGALLMMAGEEGWSSAIPEETLRFDRLDVKGFPKAVASWLTSCHRLDMGASAFTKVHNGRTYVFVSSGLKPTGGYRVRISRIVRTSDRGLAVHAFFTAPSKTSVVTQQLTRPYDCVAIHDTGWVVTVMPEGNSAPPHTARLVGIRELKSIVGESRAIKIFSPPPGGTVKRTFEISGVALVFEGTVQIRLSTGGGRILARTFTTAASGSEWGYFAKSLVVPDSLPAGTSLRLELYTVDEEEGVETNLVRSFLTLHRREGA